MIDVLKPLIKQFMPFAQKQMGFNRPPKLFLRQNSQNSADPLGKTGFYDPANESITIYITDRHPKDVMRSLAHELMHHAQNCKGDFDNVENMGEQGYAQSNTHLRTMEIQAYQASIVFRDWEDSIKGTIYNESLQKGANENMSTKKWKNKEISTLLTEKWGFSMNLDKLQEGPSGPGHNPEEDYAQMGQLASDWRTIEAAKTEDECTRAGGVWDPAPEKGVNQCKPKAIGKNEAKNPYGSGVDKTDSTPSTMEKAGKQETRGTATSKRGIPSAAGSVAHPKAGRIDRTDIANKAPAEWIKEGDGTARDGDVEFPGEPPWTPPKKKSAKEDPKKKDPKKEDPKKKKKTEALYKDKMRPFNAAEEALFEEASTTCNRRHQIQGDKAVRACIEEEMTRLMNENQDLYEMCPGSEGPEEMELEFSPQGPEDVEISGLGAGDDGLGGAFQRAMDALQDLAELAGLDLTGGEEEEEEFIVQRENLKR